MSHSYLGFGIIGNLKLIFGNIASHQVEKLSFWDDYLTMVQIVYLFLDIVNKELKNSCQIPSYQENIF